MPGKLDYQVKPVNSNLIQMLDKKKKGCNLKILMYLAGDYQV